MSKTEIVAGWRERPCGIVVVRNDLFELEVDKVLRVERALFLHWLVAFEVPVGRGRDGADAEEDEGEIGGLVLRRRCR